MPQDWFTTDNLATVATATIALRIVVEFTKEYVDQWTKKRLPTLFYALLWAFFILFGVQVVRHQLSAENAFLNVFNAFLMVGLAKIMVKDQPPPQQ